MNKLSEVLIELAAKVVLPLAERLQQRRERRTPVPKLDPELKKLSIEDAVAAARKDLEARRRKERGNAH